MTSLPLTNLPLSGKTILVTRAAGQSSQFTRLLQQQGATVLEMPALEIMPPSSWNKLDQAIAHLDQFDWLILTSANGVHYFFERLTAQGLTPAALQSLKIAVVGQKTADTLAQYPVPPAFIPPDFVADSLIAHFPDAERLPSLKILFPRVETGGREVLVQEFTVRGATVVEVPAYQSGCASSIPEAVQIALQQGQIDLLTFASSKTAQCAYQLFSTQLQLPQPFSQWLDSLLIASIGPQTSATCRKTFGRVDIEAKDYTLEGLTDAIVRFIHPPPTHPPQTPHPPSELTRVIGLTGGIGMGKTTVSQYLESTHHLPVLDADLYARAVVEPGSPVLARLAQRYGSGLLLPSGHLNRARLAEIIFSQAAERQWVEQQIHPDVRARIAADLRLLSAQGHRTAVVVVPLLFEAGMTDLVTEIWVVHSTPAQQLDRLQQRDRLTLEQIQARMNSQMAIEQKIAQADVILENSFGLEQLFQQVDQALQRHEV